MAWAFKVISSAACDECCSLEEQLETIILLERLLHWHYCQARQSSASLQHQGWQGCFCLSRYSSLVAAVDSKEHLSHFQVYSQTSTLKQLLQNKPAEQPSPEGEITIRERGWWKRIWLIKTNSQCTFSTSQHAVFRSHTSQNHSVLLSKSSRHVLLPTVSPLHCTFKDFCSIPIGKPSVGSVVSQRRKSLWGFVIFSRAFSRLTSHFTKRWQFCNISHPPLTTASSSICKAIWRGGKNQLRVTLPLSSEQLSLYPVSRLTQWISAG